MAQKFKIALEEIIEWLGEDVVVEGVVAREVTGLATVEAGAAGDLGFLRKGKKAAVLVASGLGVVLVDKGLQGARPAAQTWLRVADPSLALGEISARLLARWRPPFAEGVHPTAVIEADVEIGAGCHVGPLCWLRRGARLAEGVILEGRVTLGEGVRIGARTRLHAGVVVEWDCVIGADCEIHAGAVIGSDGFGYHSDASGHRKLAQVGNVVIEDNVEIGANTCVDRARFASTLVRRGAKVDNMVQIAHNCVIGEHALLCAQVGMAGSADIGNFVVLAGQVGVNGHIKVGDGVIGTAKSGISKTLPPGQVVSGVPAGPHREQLRLQAALRSLPELTARLAALEARLEG